jgi:H+/Cl- antiporter ClcA
MQKVILFKKRSKHLYYAFILSLNILFVACLVLYPYFRLPLSSSLVSYSLLIIFVVGLLSLSLALFLRRRLFPISTLRDDYWSYTATRRYFWLYALSLTPFGLSFLIYILFAPLSVLILGYLLSLCGLILVRPKEEDLS